MRTIGVEVRKLDWKSYRYQTCFYLATPTSKWCRALTRTALDSFGQTNIQFRRRGSNCSELVLQNQVPIPVSMFLGWISFDFRPGLVPVGHLLTTPILLDQENSFCSVIVPHKK